jgi:hypothetical protein
VWVGKAGLVVGLMRIGLGFGRAGVGMKGLWLNVVDGRQSERDRWGTTAWRSQKVNGLPLEFPPPPKKICARTPCELGTVDGWL